MKYYINYKDNKWSVWDKEEALARGDHVLSPLISISEAPIDSYGLMDMEQCGALLRYCDKEKLKT